MKKIIALLLLVTSIFLLAACGETEYDPIESTELEKSVVMTLTFDGTTYDVKYELYRAFFLNLKSEVDGGDEGVWVGENKDAYINQIDTLIKKNVADIYGTIHAAKKINIDVFSDEYDKKVKEYIEVSVDGGDYNGVYFEGFDGEYSDYLASLAAMNLNYGAQDTMLRYAFAREEIYTYYAGDFDAEYAEDVVTGNLQFTRNDVLAFYKSDACVRVIKAVLSKENYSKERIQAIRENFVEKSKINDTAVANYAIQTSLPEIAPSTFIDGEIIAKHNLDPLSNEEIIYAAFDLGYFKVSEVLEFTGTSGESYYSILYKFLKTDEHFEKCYDSIANVYVNNEIGKIIDGYSEGFYNSAAETLFLKGLVRQTISMTNGNS